MEETKNEVAALQADDTKLSKRNFFMFPLGTLGRDFLYNFFNGYLLSFCVLTKHLNVAQFTAITFIIVAARIFDAFNDPIMGGIVENTRTKWGKYKPWQLIGCVLTAGVIIALFNIPADGWGFIALIAVMYFLFSITFTMNDISYWGMMPTLTSDPHDRDKLMSFTQIIVAIGGGSAGLIVPTLTAGDMAIGGNAQTGYGVLAIVAAVLMCGFQLFTILGVKEKPLSKNLVKTPPMKLKDMFRVLFKKRPTYVVRARHVAFQCRHKRSRRRFGNDVRVFRVRLQRNALDGVWRRLCRGFGGVYAHISVACQEIR